MGEGTNKLKSKFHGLISKWLKLSDLFKILSLAGCIIFIGIIIAIPVTISSLNKFSEEHKTAYDLVTTYYYDILDDHGYDSVELIQVKKCKVYSYEYSDYSYCGGWFILSINEEYESYYFIQLTSDGLSDTLQKTDYQNGKNWDFSSAISTKPLNKKLKVFFQEEKELLNA